MRSKNAKPITRREREPGEYASFVIAGPSAVMVSSLRDRSPTRAPKDTPHYSEAWRRAVADLPCVQCNKPSQAAHRNEGKGMGMKTDDCLTAALCPACHSEIDQGSHLTREERRSRIDAAILRTLVLLFRAGKVRVA